MPTTLERRKARVPQNRALPSDANSGPTGLNAAKASEALADGLSYLRDQWSWNGSKIARVLHLSPTTINGWLRNKNVPVSSKTLTPDVQAVVHLLAVHRNLRAMFSESFHQLHWLTNVHPDLGVVPLAKMSESLAGLILVRQYLDYVRGRGA